MSVQTSIDALRSNLNRLGELYGAILKNYEDINGKYSGVCRTVEALRKELDSLNERISNSQGGVYTEEATDEDIAEIARGVLVVGERRPCGSCGIDLREAEDADIVEAARVAFGSFSETGGHGCNAEEATEQDIALIARDVFGVP